MKKLLGLFFGSGALFSGLFFLFSSPPSITVGKKASVTGKHIKAGYRAYLKHGLLDSGSFELELPSGESVTITLEQREKMVGPHRGRVFVGHVEGEPDGTAVFVVRGKSVSGTVQSIGRQFAVLPTGRGDHQVVEMDVKSLPGDSVLYPDKKKSVVTEAEEVDDAVTSDTSEVDVMVLYTEAARLAAGGVAGIESTIDMAVAAANNAYAASGAFISLRLVYTQEVVGYTETGYTGDDLVYLQDQSDRHLDEIHALRDQYGADLVSLIVENSSTSCGTGYVLPALDPGYDEYGFNVVRRICAVGYYSFAHEVGHNLGSYHDHNQSGVGIFPYAMGHHFTGDSGVEYRTIMAYSPGQRIGRFSNPGLSYDGGLTGVPIGDRGEAHNAQAFTTTAPYVAGFRATEVGSGGTEPNPNPLPSEPKLTAIPTSVDFGKVFIDAQPQTRLVSVVNDGTADMVVDPVLPPDLPVYRVVSEDCSGAVVQPGAGCNVVIEFTPLDAVSYSSSMTVTSNGGGDALINLYGYGAVKKGKGSGNGKGHGRK